MMGTFYGREWKTGRTCGRGCACTENNRGSDVYGFELAEPVEQGDVIDFVVGFGNGDYGFDSTGLDAKITLGPEEKSRTPWP
ncbi:MAG: hypothetical protein WCK89_15650 [bacterium]